MIYEMGTIRQCNNKGCNKDHCAHHMRIKTDAGKDMNPENKFMCPSYEPKSKYKMKYVR